MDLYKKSLIEKEITGLHKYLLQRIIDSPCEFYNRNKDKIEIKNKKYIFKNRQLILFFNKTSGINFFQGFEDLRKGKKIVSYKELDSFIHNAFNKKETLKTYLSQYGKL